MAISAPPSLAIILHHVDWLGKGCSVLTTAILPSPIEVRSALFTPFFLTDISDGDWLHSLQHILQVGCVVGQTAGASMRGVGSCREIVEGVGG
jgi:hypothetical protein